MPQLSSIVKRPEPQPDFFWLTFDELAAIVFFVVPLASLLYSRLCSRRADGAGKALAASAEYDFASLMNRFRAADPDRVGLTYESLAHVVGAEGAAALDEAFGHAKYDGSRVSVAEFVPVACHLAASPSCTGVRGSADLEPPAAAVVVTTQWPTQWPGAAPPSRTAVPLVSGHAGGGTSSFRSRRRTAAAYTRWSSAGSRWMRAISCGACWRIHAHLPFKHNAWNDLPGESAAAAATAAGDVAAALSGSSSAPREAVVLTVDAVSLSRWLAVEHRRIINVMLLSSVCGASIGTTTEAAKAVVAAEAAAVETCVESHFGSNASGRAGGAPGVPPCSADSIQLCISLLQTLKELADSGDVLGGASTGEPVAPPSGTVDPVHSRHMVASAAAVKAALAGGELAERVAALVGSELVGSTRLRRLQLDLRTHALAVLRSLLEGPTPPISLPFMLLRTLRPAALRRALHAHLVESRSALGSSGRAYDEELAMLLVALMNAATEAFEGAKCAAAAAAAVADARQPAGTTSGDAGSCAQAAATKAAQAVALMEAELQEQYAAEQAFAGRPSAWPFGRGAAKPSAVDALLRQVWAVPLPLPFASTAHGAQRLWFVMPPEARCALSSPAVAAAVLRLFIRGDGCGGSGGGGGGGCSGSGSSRSAAVSSAAASYSFRGGGARPHETAMLAKLDRLAVFLRAADGTALAPLLRLLLACAVIIATIPIDSRPPATSTATSISSTAAEPLLGGTSASEVAGCGVARRLALRPFLWPDVYMVTAVAALVGGGSIAISTLCGLVRASGYPHAALQLSGLLCALAGLTSPPLLLSTWWVGGGLTTAAALSMDGCVPPAGAPHGAASRQLLPSGRDDAEAARRTEPGLVHLAYLVRARRQLAIDAARAMAKSPVADSTVVPHPAMRAVMDALVDGPEKPPPHRHSGHQRAAGAVDYNSLACALLPPCPLASSTLAAMPLTSAPLWNGSPHKPHPVPPVPLPATDALLRVDYDHAYDSWGRQQATYKSSGLGRTVQRQLSVTDADTDDRTSTIIPGAHPSSSCSDASLVEERLGPTLVTLGESIFPQQATSPPGFGEAMTGLKGELLVLTHLAERQRVTLTQLQMQLADWRGERGARGADKGGGGGGTMSGMENSHLEGTGVERVRAEAVRAARVGRDAHYVPLPRQPSASKLAGTPRASERHETGARSHRSAIPGEQTQALSKDKPGRLYRRGSENSTPRVQAATPHTAALQPAATPRAIGTPQAAATLCDTRSRTASRRCTSTSQYAASVANGSQCRRDNRACEGRELLSISEMGELKAAARAVEPTVAPATSATSATPAPAAAAVTTTAAASAVASTAASVAVATSDASVLTSSALAVGGTLVEPHSATSSVATTVLLNVSLGETLEGGTDEEDKEGEEGEEGGEGEGGEEEEEEEEDTISVGRAEEEPAVWYYFDGTLQHGPVSATYLADVRADGELHTRGRALFWRDGMDDWLPFAEVPLLAKEMEY